MSCGMTISVVRFQRNHPLADMGRCHDCFVLNLPVLNMEEELGDLVLADLPSGINGINPRRISISRLERVYEDKGTKCPDCNAI